MRSEGGIRNLICGVVGGLVCLQRCKFMRWLGSRWCSIIFMHLRINVLDLE